VETTQRISPYSYPCLKLAKMPCFSYYLLCFFFNKIGEQEDRTGSAQRRGEGGEGEVAQIMYTQVSTCKNDKIKLKKKKLRIWKMG
jgi:hypothetical protein